MLRVLYFNNVYYKYSRLCNALFPRVCLLCKEPATDACGLCCHCINQLPSIKISCKHCGVPVSNASLLCGSCAKKKPEYHTLSAPFRYDDPIDGLIKQLKYGQNLAVVSALARLFLKHVEIRGKPDVIIPIPLHAASLRQRGFNQAHELARLIGRELNVPVRSCLEKTRRTVPQSSLPTHRRHHNLRGAFDIKHTFKAGSHVVIFDDVVTTGQTISEAVRALKQQPLSQIDVWCIARTSPGSKK